MNSPDKDFRTRPLVADDLQRVMEIDAQYTERRREGFYRLRLQAAQADPAGFVYLGCEDEGVLQGFLLARLQEGEYGTSDRYASLDAISVDPDMAGKGMGRALLMALDEILRHKGIDTTYSQADWHNYPMLRFFSGNEFTRASRHVLERDATNLPDFEYSNDLIEESGRLGDANDYSDAEGDQRGALVRDLIQCRSMHESDIDAIVKIDKRTTGHDHRAYYEQKMEEALSVSGIRVSLVAEQDDHVVGFVMARVDFGEFDRIEPVAVLDSIAVDPGYAHHLVGTALLSQLLANLWTLQIEQVRSEADAEHYDVLRFLQRNGFRISQRLAFERKTA